MNKYDKALEESAQQLKKDIPANDLDVMHFIDMRLTNKITLRGFHDLVGAGMDFRSSVIVKAFKKEAKMWIIELDLDWDDMNAYIDLMICTRDSRNPASN